MGHFQQISILRSFAMMHLSMIEESSSNLAFSDSIASTASIVSINGECISPSSVLYQPSMHPTRSRMRLLTFSLNESPRSLTYVVFRESPCESNTCLARPRYMHAWLYNPRIDLPTYTQRPNVQAPAAWHSLAQAY